MIKILGSNRNNSLAQYNETIGNENAERKRKIHTIIRKKEREIRQREKMIRKLLKIDQIKEKRTSSERKWAASHARDAQNSTQTTGPDETNKERLVRRENRRNKKASD